MIIITHIYSRVNNYLNKSSNTTSLLTRLELFAFKMPKVVTGTLAAAVGTFTNTFFVMGSIYIFYGKDLIAGMAETLGGNGFIVETLSGFGGFWAVLFCTMITNGFWEIAGACIITFAVLGSVYLVKNKRSKLSKLEEDDDRNDAAKES